MTLTLNVFFFCGAKIVQKPRKTKYEMRFFQLNCFPPLKNPKFNVEVVSEKRIGKYGFRDVSALLCTAMAACGGALFRCNLHSVNERGGKTVGLKAVYTLYGYSARGTNLFYLHGRVCCVL